MITCPGHTSRAPSHFRPAGRNRRHQSRCWKAAVDQRRLVADWRCSGAAPKRQLSEPELPTSARSALGCRAAGRYHTLASRSRPSAVIRPNVLGGGNAAVPVFPGPPLNSRSQLQSGRPRAQTIAAPTTGLKGGHSRMSARGDEISTADAQGPRTPDGTEKRLNVRCSRPRTRAADPQRPFVASASMPESSRS